MLHRDPLMDGTWAPTERGVTATSSKCPVFKGAEGALWPPQMFQMLCQPVIIPATSLPPHCLHLCAQNADSLFPSLLHTLCPHLVSLSHTLAHPQRSSCRLPYTRSRSGRVEAADHGEIHLCRGLYFILESADSPEDAGI